ncbi:MAG: hypothetical protein Q9228_005182 [Teloschistes exilis]
MAALHTALQSLGPSDFSSVPIERPRTKEYLQDLFTQAQIIIDSVPPPLEPPSTPARSRANTLTSSASSASDLSASLARSDPIDLANTTLQREWSKPIRLGAKENPLSMSVYKLGGKDGKGAWFARRSVHEGMGFRKWKLGLQREFPETMEVQGGPGEGNIRGIGGERRVEKIEVDGVGTIEVYHLSAQFPGPTTPRDFVTLLVTSSAALERPDAPKELEPPRNGKAGRHFMVISKPCIHPECPPRDGFIRGQYESVEFIREIPIKPTKSSSTSDLLRLRHPSPEPSPEKDALVQNAQRSLDQGGSSEEMLASMGTDSHLSVAKDVLVQEGRKRGKTISFAESRGERAKGEVLDTPHEEFDDPAEQNPVEWIMVTRSDPGGSVPRFMVERGTPSGIVADASKFLDWACKKKHPVKDDYGEKAQDVDQEIAQTSSQAQGLEQYQTNGHLAGLEEEVPDSAQSSTTLTSKSTTTMGQTASKSNRQEGLMSTLTNAAVAGIESYAPQAVIDRLPEHKSENTESTMLPNEAETPASDGDENASEAAFVASSSETASFVSAEEGSEDGSPKVIRSKTGSSPIQERHDREFAKFQQRLKALDEQLARTREKETKDKEELTSKEEERIRKAEEKRAREVAKLEQRYQKEVAKSESKRVKDEQKTAERQKKAEGKDEKTRLTKERDAARSELEKMKMEKELLKEQVGALQRENTALVAKIGKLEMGKKMLGEVQAEIESGGRSRSSSIRRKQAEPLAESGVDATSLASTGEKRS